MIIKMINITYRSIIITIIIMIIIMVIYIYICRNIKRKIMRKERTRANLDMMSYDSPRQTASSQQVDPYPPCV